MFDTPPAWCASVVANFQGRFWAPDISRHDDTYYLYYCVSAGGKITSAIGVATNRTLDRSCARLSLGGSRHRGAVGALPRPVERHRSATHRRRRTARRGWPSDRSGPDCASRNSRPTACGSPSPSNGTRSPSANARCSSTTPNPSRPPSKRRSFSARATTTICSSPGITAAAASTATTRWWSAARASSPARTSTANDERLDKGGGTLLIAGNARWPGIGHNSVYTFDGRDYFVAHAYDARDRGWSKLKILELQWDATAGRRSRRCARPRPT